MKKDIQIVHTALAFVFSAFLSASAQDVWTGADAANSTNWTDPANWQAGTAPLPYDSLDFSGSVAANSNGFPNGTAFDGLSFDGAAGVSFNLTGNSILLSGQTTANFNGVANNSVIPQAVSLNLNLDWGYYTFTGNISLGLGLNGGLTPNLGGVAYFDPNVTAASLTTDSSGLMAGLGGAGLMYSSGTLATPTGLAAISGDAVSAYTYSGGNMIASGNIPSGAGNNLELTASGSSIVYSNTVGAGNIFASTIRVLQAGNGNTVITTLTNASTAILVLGTNNAGAGPYVGGIYVLDSAAGSRTNFLLNGGHLTAGPMSGPATPGEIVFGINGTTFSNQMEMNSIIQNNGSGGAVTVVKIGSGAMYFNTASTYSGGTYVEEGQLQGSTSTSAFGAGPIYVAAGATLLTAVGGTIANNLYLSPGLGDTTTSGEITSPGALVWNNSVTYSGTITLMGPPAMTGHGDRISGNDTGGSVSITGQITGTGTLEFGGAHTVGAYTLANTSTNTNNWQGGLILNANTGVAVNTYLKMGANNQLPSGPNAGNVTLIPATGSVYARLDLNGFNATINGLMASSGGNFAQIADFGTANATLTLGANDATASFSGTSSDSGAGKALSLVKIGAGTQTFSGPLNHTGNTTISNGTFQMLSMMPSNAVTTVGPAGTWDVTYQGFLEGANQTITGTGLIDGSLIINGTLSAIMAVAGASTNIGTLTVTNGTVTLDGGCTNLWYINNATGTAGAASGWSLVNVGNNASLSLSGSVTLTSPVHLKIVSLTAGGSPGDAAFNPNISQSWTLMQSISPITGFTGASQFVIDTSAFANLPSGSSQFSIGTNATGDDLVLYFTSTPVITSGLPVNQTNNAGSTATFTVSAAGAAPITYQWVEGGTTVLVNGGNSLSGGAVTITTNLTGTSSTLTIANVQDADQGVISVFVTNGAAGSGSSSVNFYVIDPPSNPSITTSGASSITDPYSGGIEYLNAGANGTAPFTYVWSFDGSVISGATSSSLAVELSPTSMGSYTVVIGNQAGVVTNSPFAIGSVTHVSNQLIYENFDSYAQMGGDSAPYTWAGVTNVYNQLDGEPAYWFHSSGSHINMVISGNQFSSFTANNAPGYPWPGLAGDSLNCMYHEVSSSSTDNDQLEFYTNSFKPGTSVYFSFLLSCQNLGSAVTSDCIAAFNVTTSGGTSFNLKLSTYIPNDGSGTYWLGLSKGDGNTGASQGVDAYTLWQTNFQPNQDVFVVGVYQINSGLSTTNDDTVAMWFDPTNSSFGTTNVPLPSLGPTNFGVPNSSSIHTFVVHGVELPGYRYYSDLRIGTTWASVTPMSAPNLTLSNVFIVPGSSATFTSENAGNPVTNYQWYFNGTNGMPLTDGPNPTGDGSIITNSATGALTIIGATAADLGTYTVIGINTDPVTGDILTGSAFATLTFLSPPLAVAYQAPNVVLTWPTNYAAFTLEHTVSLAPSNWITVATNSYIVSGTNYTFTANPSGASLFFRLIGP